MHPQGSIRHDPGNKHTKQYQEHMQQMPLIAPSGQTLAWRALPAALKTVPGAHAEDAIGSTTMKGRL